MIVLGADTHKRSHTIAAVSATTGELMGEQTVQVGAKGFAALIVWARELGAERVWALEDCRHVSGSFERFLIERGERVLRVTTKLMADSRRRARGRGKSDSIDAIAVARAALREGLDALPAAQLQGPELDLRLLVDHRERLVASSDAPARRAVRLGGCDAEHGVGREPEEVPRRRAGAGRAVGRGERVAIDLHGPTALAVDRGDRLERRCVDDAPGLVLEDQVHARQARGDGARRVRRDVTCLAGVGPALEEQVAVLPGDADPGRMRPPVGTPAARMSLGRLHGIVCDP
jgi:transposase